MNATAVGSASSNLQTQAAQLAQVTAQVNKADSGNDGDSDEGGAKAVNAAPTPTVNLNGQKIGQLINVSA